MFVRRIASGSTGRGIFGGESKARGFFGGAARRRQLNKIGRRSFRMHGLGDIEPASSWSDDLLKFASSAANIVNSQRVFNAQYQRAKATGQPMIDYRQSYRDAPAQAPRPDYTKMALIGGVGIATLFVGMKLLRR